MIVHIGPNLWPFIRSVVECFQSAESVLRNDLIEAEMRRVGLRTSDALRLTLVSETRATASYRIKCRPITGNLGTR